MYETYPDGGVRRLSDNAYIPPDEKNRDYKEYLEWVKLGNTAEPAVSAEKLAEGETKATQEQLIQAKMKELAIKALIDEGKLPVDYK